MKKIALSLMLSLLFLGCSEPKTVLDTNTGNPVENKKQDYKLKHFTQEVECNEYNIAYYKSNVSGNLVWGESYAPVYNHDGKPVTCQEYEDQYKQEHEGMK